MLVRPADCTRRHPPAGRPAALAETQTSAPSTANRILPYAADIGKGAGLFLCFRLPQRWQLRAALCSHSNLVHQSVWRFIERAPAQPTTRARFCNEHRTRLADRKDAVDFRLRPRWRTGEQPLFYGARIRPGLLCQSRFRQCWRSLRAVDGNR